ncbi:uncharacterized protein CCOS01_03872 [Colletotrichum costaricense]|uniref:Uncharacterized protein n=1 Tax=Colletotrichum costaricense TaxID=1209916 RepID=A0AAI9Z5V5_9PEZI|nr:uncharacterized protein CCOS01_03872 [Colletotrichum costaricense]KAK1535120.1 hypothetical protein CCOS01_03872 [Colletotrichum costaricense]
MTTENLGGGGGKATHLHRRSWNCGCKICPGCPRSYTSQRNAQATQSKAQHTFFSKEDALYSRETQFRFQRSHAMHLVEEAPPLRIHTCLTYMLLLLLLLLLLRMMGASRRCTHTPTLEEA